MSAKKTYKVNTATNFSIADQEFYLSVGDEIELPDHELIDSMVVQKHLTRVEVKEQKQKGTETTKN